MKWSGRLVQVRSFGWTDQVDCFAWDHLDELIRSTVSHEIIEMNWPGRLAQTKWVSCADLGRPVQVLNCHKPQSPSKSIIYLNPMNITNACLHQQWTCLPFLPLYTLKSQKVFVSLHNMAPRKAFNVHQACSIQYGRYDQCVQLLNFWQKLYTGQRDKDSTSI